MKITIVGLRCGQEHHVAKQCQGLAVLSFVDADKAEIAFPASDAVILMTKFIRHTCTLAASASSCEKSNGSPAATRTWRGCRRDFFSSGRQHFHHEKDNEPHR
jgi:hypothetical protein